MKNTKPASHNTQALKNAITMPQRPLAYNITLVLKQNIKLPDNLYHLLLEQKAYKICKSHLSLVHYKSTNYIVLTILIESFGFDFHVSLMEICNQLQESMHFYKN